MEHVTASYLRQVCDKNDWLYERQHGFRLGYSCERQIITVCQDIADALDNGDKIDAIIVEFSKAFDLVPRGLLGICCWLTVCIVVVDLCVLLSYVYLLYCVCIVFFLL